MNQKSPNDLKYGDIVSSSGGSSRFKKVFHVCSPYWNDKDKAVQDWVIKILKIIAFDLLKECDKEKVKSIVLPPIATGICEVPNKVCAMALYEGF